jgi:hypothetical protein
LTVPDFSRRTKQRDSLHYRSADECPDRATLHTLHPTGYLEHSTWAARMSECHTQERCPTCGFWATWKDADGQIVLNPVLTPLRAEEPEQPPCNACKGVGWYEAQESPTGRCEVCGRSLP